MDYFNDAFTTVLGLEIGSCVNGGTETSQISLKRSSFVQKMNESLKGLKQHKGEYLMTEFSFLGERSLRGILSTLFWK